MFIIGSIYQFQFDIDYNMYVIVTKPIWSMDLLQFHSNECAIELDGGNDLDDDAYPRKHKNN